MHARSEELNGLLRGLKLSTMAETYADLAVRSAREGLTHEQYLYELALLERQSRDQRRVERLLLQSFLPREKTFDTLEMSYFPPFVRQQIERLRNGSFLDEAINVVAVGTPGTGKSHLAAALGLSLVNMSRSVLYTPAFALVQRLLAAKRDLKLPQELAKLDRFECLILDDIGYIQQDQAEMEVLFALLADRYERRSTVITTNLAFSEWNKVFKNPMTTLAAIDRVVHHSVVIDLMDMDSYRARQAAERRQSEEDDKEE